MFSLLATKALNIFEGGGVTTNNVEHSRGICELKNFGFGVKNSTQFLGTNDKLAAISAAMRIVNQENIEHKIEVNKVNYRAHRENLKNTFWINLIEYPHNKKENYRHVIIEAGLIFFGLNRSGISVELQVEGIGTRKYFWPACHQMEPYKTLFPSAGLRLSITESIAERVLALPTGTAVSLNDVNSICDIIRLAIKEPDTFKNQLAKYLAEGSFR